MREETVAAGRPGVAGGEAGEDQEFLARGIEAVPDAVLVKDERHRFVLLNSAFARLMGRAAPTLLGHTDFDFVPPEEAGLFWRIDEEVLASGGPHENREILTDAAGRQHHLVARKSLVVAPGGRRYIVAAVVNHANAARAAPALDYLVQWVYEEAGHYDRALRR